MSCPVCDHTMVIVHSPQPSRSWCLRCGALKEDFGGGDNYEVSYPSWMQAFGTRPDIIKAIVKREYGVIADIKQYFGFSK